MYFWIYLGSGGNLVISTPFKDYYDCETEYVQKMQRLQAGGVDLARLDYRCVMPAHQLKDVLEAHMNGDTHVVG